MNQPVNLNLVADQEPVAPLPEPKVFVRSVSAPAGMPWSQARIAALEARLGTPLPLHEVVYQTHRLEGWRPGKPARYATFYVRAQDVLGELSTTMQVEGRSISIQFLSADEQQRRTRRLLVMALITGGLAAIIVAATIVALAARSAGESRLATIEQLALGRLKQGETIERLKQQTRALDAAGLGGRHMSDLFRDLNWASAAKSPTAHFQALHWAHGTMAVEVRGDAEPFVQADRSVVRVSKPLRAGVWLWGVTSSPTVASTPPPVQPPPQPPARRSSSHLPSSDYGDFGRGP